MHKKSWRHAALASTLVMAFTLPLSARAEADLTAKDFYVFCEYQEAIDTKAYRNLSPKRRDKKMAKKARMSLKKLRGHLKKAGAYGDTCEEVGKHFRDKAEAAVKKELPGRIQDFHMDLRTPDKVVVLIRFQGVLKKDVVADASLVAWAVHQSAPIVWTTAVRGVDPQAPDPMADNAIWFEGKISQTRAQQIKKKRIASFANTRYVKLFDGVKQK
jgi:hypothetical protein